MYQIFYVNNHSTEIIYTYNIQLLYSYVLLSV